MSLILPNGARISPATPEYFNEIVRKLRDGEPIIVTDIASDGTRTKTVLWQPGDPPMMLPPKSYVAPRKTRRSRIARWLHRIVRRKQ